MRQTSLVNKKFNRLTVIDTFSKVCSNGKSRTYCNCRCECGNTCCVRTDIIQRGTTKSCGCLNRERLLLNNGKLLKHNTYDLTTYDYAIGYDDKGNEFYFDLEDYDLLKEYYWVLNKDGYVCTRRTTNGNVNRILMHRLLKNALNNEIVDHKDKHRNNNRKNNLRICSNHQNSMNTSIRKTNKSGVIGVHIDKTCNKWRASISIDYKCINLGRYENKLDAIKARLGAELKYFGEFAPQKHLFEQYGI